MLAPFGIMAALTAIGMLCNLDEWGNGRGDVRYTINIVWSLVNILTLSLVVLACVELPRPRREERFSVNEIAKLRLPDGRYIACQVVDLAVSGAKLTCDWPTDAGDRADLLLQAPDLILPFQIRRAEHGIVAGNFVGDVSLRRELIARIFTGKYSNDVTALSFRYTMASALKRLFQ